MHRPSQDFTSARQWMVDGQVRPNKVYDPRIIAAMRSLPRELFVPDAQVSLAYADAPVPLGGGRALLEPMVIARMVQTAAARSGDRALVVGAGAGYGAALLAACGAQVTALDDDAAVQALAPRALAGIGGVSIVTGPLAAGWKAGAPYDVILIEGAADEVPEALVAQLRAPGGRLVAVRPGAGPLGTAVLAEHSGGALSFQPVFDCAAPLLAALAREPAFVF